ncbi:MAG TPA: adenosylhomocysteinase [Patescibacteria group bacterium]|jgi:adenosylhomocysteinase|nr:adenosylhomocysteinase [Patescibacteria group bacterium]
MKYDVKNLKLADKGLLRINWAEREMPVLNSIRSDFKIRKPLKNLRITACLHVTAETANLMHTLKVGGAKVVLCASNPLSTQDEVAAALVSKFKIPVFAKRGENRKLYYSHLLQALSGKPDYLMDDGADLVGLVHGEQKALAKKIIGAAEETTTGVIRLKSLAEKNLLKFPVVAVNDSKVKYLFDNRYGTGQSTIDGILRATNILLAGKKFVVAGYGWVGKGIARRASGMGAGVIVTEVDSTAALEAKMDGFEVLSMFDAAAIGDIFVTATGNKHVIDNRHFLRMKDGAILANAGHFNVEINIPVLEELSKKQQEVRANLKAFILSKEKTLYLIADGRLVNLASAEGHPAAVMDLSFSAQAKAIEFVVKNRRKLKKQVYQLPASVEEDIAKLKLRAMGVEVDQLTAEQKQYLSSWEAGT